MVSTLVGESLDSMIFLPVALGGIVPAGNLALLVLSQAVFKTLYEFLVLPLTTWVVARVKEREGEDVFDRNISYNVFKVSDI